MGADHDDFVLLVGAGDLGDRVPLHLVFVHEVNLDVELELDGDFPVEQPGNPAEVLRLHRQLGGRRLRLRDAPLTAALDVERPEVAAAEIDDRERLLVGEKRVHGLAQLEALDVLLTVVARLPRRLVLRELFQRLLVVARQVRRVVRLDLPHVAIEHDLPGEAALESRQLVLGLRVQADDRRTDRAVGAWGPGLRKREQLGVVGGDHPHRARLVLPSPAERSPRLEVGIGHPPLGELVLRPLVGFLDLRGAGEPGTDPVHQLRRRLHDLRVVKPFLPDPGHHLQIDALFGRQAERRDGGETDARDESLQGTPP